MIGLLWSGSNVVALLAKNRWLEATMNTPTTAINAHTSGRVSRSSSQIRPNPNPNKTDVLANKAAMAIQKVCFSKVYIVTPK